MSKYTTELRFICETLADKTESVGLNDTTDVINSARPKIFNFQYPIFDVLYKPTLETKILRHFYTREIGQETYGLWKLRLEARMNEIMPYYNKLYQSELLEFNPLYDTDINTIGHRDDSGEGSSDTTFGGQDVETKGGSDTYTEAMKNDEWRLFSDTPQGGIDGIEAASDPSLNSNGYLTNATHILGDTDGSENTTEYGGTRTTDYGRTTNTDVEHDNDIDYTEHVYGYRGKSPSKSLKEFRETMLNIDMMVIRELEDLFFQLW